MIVALSLLATAPAMADPPSTDPNTNVLSFNCSRGSEVQDFQAVAILQSAATAGQRSDGHGVIVFTHIEIDGQVIFDIPGQAARSDLVMRHRGALELSFLRSWRRGGIEVAPTS